MGGWDEQYSFVYELKFMFYVYITVSLFILFTSSNQNLSFFFKKSSPSLNPSKSL